MSGQRKGFYPSSLIRKKDPKNSDWPGQSSIQSLDWGRGTGGGTLWMGYHLMGLPPFTGRVNMAGRVTH